MATPETPDAQSGEVKELTEAIGELMSRASELGEEVKSGNRDTAEVKAELEAIKPELARLSKERKEKEDELALRSISEEITALREDYAKPTPSKAWLIGSGTHRSDPSDPNDLSKLFFVNVALSKDRDYDVQKAAKERLLAMGGVPAPMQLNEAGIKATTGDGASPGVGYLIPNNLVGPVIETATAQNPYRRLLTVITNVRGRAVDVPTEGLAPTRAQVVAWGASKPEVDFTMPAYTATLYTIARIHDVANQLLRHSAGAAEQLIRDKLARAFALGEAYYVLSGSGSSEPKGLLTSIGTSGTFVSSFTAASSTIAGASASAIAKAAGVLANRARRPEAAVCNAGDFYVMLAQGSDTAGYWFSPDTGPTGIDPTRGQLTVFGIPTIPDINMPSDSMVVGEFSSAQLFIGDDFRIDVSSEAGTRFDTNVTGFRGEEEIAFNADPYVAAGMFQRITDFTP